MKRQREIDERERAFELQELFFSTTDPKGRINSGNETFARVSGYSFDELLGAPHNIVRHPDMPRVVFRVLWDHLEAGEPVAAYVKNRAKDGSHYWVMALAFPTPGGFTSLRLKPSTRLLPDVVEPLYRQMLAVEAEHAEQGRTSSMDESEGILRSALRSLGFVTYDDFMRHAFAAEVTLRRRQMPPKVQPRTIGAAVDAPPAVLMRDACDRLSFQLGEIAGHLERYDQMSTEFSRSGRFFADLADHVGTLAMNARLNAVRAGGAVVLEAVAQLMTSCAVEAGNVVASLGDALERAVDSVRRVAFSTAAAELEIEMLTLFLDELILGERNQINSVAEVWALVQSAEGHLGNLDSELSVLERALDALPRQLGGLERCLHELRALRVRAIVEASRIDGAEEFALIMGGISERLAPAITRCSDLLALAQSTNGAEARLVARRVGDLVRRLHDLA